MKIWIDDVRPAPTGYYLTALSVNTAIQLLANGELKLTIENCINTMVEYDRCISEIKKFSNANQQKIEKLKDVVTEHIQTCGGTASGALHYVCGELQKGTTLDEVINKLKKGCEKMTIRNDAYSALFNSYGNQYTDGNGMIPYKELNRRIKDVNILVENKVVEVTFADGTKEKAVCQEPDVFSLETAIAICLSKKIMGGSSAYNNAVKRGVKVYEDKIKEAELAKAEHERIAKKRAKRLAYKERKMAKRKAQEREEKIEIQKEAYIRAMTYMNDASKNVSAKVLTE